MKDKMTVAEFAEIVGITQQAVYKQLNTKLKKYTTVESGKRYIDSHAIKLYDKEVEQQYNKSCEIVVKQLQTELNGKNVLIEQLQTELKDKDNYISSMTSQIEQLQELLKHEQELRLLDKKLLEGKQGLFKRLFSRKEKKTE